MQKLLKKLEAFFKNNAPAIIVNTATDRALLCLQPALEVQKDRIFLRFESLNNKGGSSVYLKAVHGEERDTLYVANEEDNILMLQKLSLANYHGYIKPQYFNAPAIYDEQIIINYISGIHV